MATFALRRYFIARRLLVSDKLFGACPFAIRTKTVESLPIKDTKEDTQPSGEHGALLYVPTPQIYGRSRLLRNSCTNGLKEQERVRGWRGDTGMKR